MGRSPQSKHVLRYIPATARFSRVADAEVVREFPHAGSAVAWIRRLIKRGDTLLPSAELTVVTDGYEDTTYEITETEIRRWSRNNNDTWSNGATCTALGADLKRIPRRDHDYDYS